jgi:HPt (histidine-containing phosphotransfer) domain-containing protein
LPRKKAPTLPTAAVEFTGLSPLVGMMSANYPDTAGERERLMAVLSLLAEHGAAATPGVIDEDHLGKMTLGDRSLEREVLEIFARQTTLMLGRLVGAEPARAAAMAHTLKGSARGIGAWQVAQATEQLERAADRRDDEALGEALSQLEAACAEVRQAIAARLGGR